MTARPLDPLGEALAAYREGVRQDIDWQGHPLMRVYEAAHTGMLCRRPYSARRPHPDARVKRGGP